MEPGTRVECPSCHRVALLRQANKPPTRRVDREKSGPRLPPLASVFFTGLGPVRRIVFAVGMVAALIGLTSLQPKDIVSAPGIPPGKSKLDKATREVNVLQIALTHFTSDCKRAPTDDEGLNALLDNPGLFGWKAPYVTLLRPDPWGHWFVYHSTGSNSWAVLSVGPDGKEGTADDVKPGQTDGGSIGPALPGQ